MVLSRERHAVDGRRGEASQLDRGLAVSLRQSVLGTREVRVVLAVLGMPFLHLRNEGVRVVRGHARMLRVVVVLLLRVRTLLWERVPRVMLVVRVGKRHPPLHLRHLLSPTGVDRIRGCSLSSPLDG